MNLRVWMLVLVLTLLAAAPGVALALCFDVTGLPEAAGLDLVPLASGPQGPVPLVGEAHGVCGLGQPPAVVQGTAIVEPNGVVRVGIKLLSARQGCGGGEAELALPPPFTTGAGQVRLPEGSITNVALAFDPTGAACQLKSPRAAACVTSATTLCLLQHRFRVTATSPGQPPLTGQARRNASESGFFSFPRPGADPSNLELTVKVLDGRGVNNHYWVAVTPSTTSVEYTLTVTDTQTGQVKTYANPVGTLSTPIFDSLAF